jgi:hypothetical protein
MLSLAMTSALAGAAADKPPTTRRAQTQPSSETSDEYWIVTVIELKGSNDTIRLQYIASNDQTDNKMHWKKVDECIFPRAALKRLIVGKAVRLHWRSTTNAKGEWSFDLIGIEDVKVPPIRPENWSVEGQIARK